jgi:hypothetical protein
MRKLTYEEEQEAKGGEAITLSAVMALLAIGIVAVVCYKMFFAKDGGKVALPGGFTFQWGD